MADDTKDDKDFQPYGVINGKRVSDEEFWDYVHKHAKRDKNGDPIITVKRVDETIH